VLRSESAGPVASNPNDHQVWPPDRTSVSSAPHSGPVARSATSATSCPPASRNRLIRRLLRTTVQPGRIHRTSTVLIPWMTEGPGGQGAGPIRGCSDTFDRFEAT
jgi:hypothetical protein